MEIKNINFGDRNTRIQNALKRAGILTIDQLKVFSLDELYCGVQNLGRCSIASIENELKEQFGMELRENPLREIERRNKAMDLMEKLNRTK